MNPARTTHENLQADIVVIGGGGAGLSAAVAAAEAGIRNIIVLETRRAPGGNSVFPGGLLGVETPLQKRLGVDASRDDVFRQAMDYAHWKANARLVRSLVDISGDNIQWLEEKGVKFERLVPHYPNQVPLAYHAIGGSGRTGAAIIKALVKNCEDLGVRLICQTDGKKLLTDGKGGVTGVLASAKEKELSISAKGVIIATGGFAGNKKLMKKYVPFHNEDEIVLGGLPHKGGGLLMAAEIGAATGGLIALEGGGPTFKWSGHLGVVAGRPNTIWVNRNGERFTDENPVSNNEAGNAIYEQPGKLCYSLFDERIKQNILAQEFGPHEGGNLTKQTLQSGIEKELQAQAAEGRIKIADSWDEIAPWMGADPKVLKATIDEYNASCDHGHDELFVKDRRYLMPLRTPPYYAIRCQTSLLVTHGGIMVNHHLEVLDIQGNPIRGLYCAGDDTSGRMGDTYNILLSGLSFGFAIGSGRIAGEEAARYVSGA